jgi:hypothetical protein
MAISAGTWHSMAIVVFPPMMGESYVFVSESDIMVFERWRLCVYLGIWILWSVGPRHEADF